MITQQDIPQSVLIGKSLLVYTSVFISICVFLFGYDQGYFSSIIINPYFRQKFDYPNNFQIGLIVSILEIGALLSSLSFSFLFHSISRRKSTQYGALFFIFGGFIQSFSFNIFTICLGRFISGLGIGILTSTAPTYISEISHSNQRGLLGCIQFTGNIVGYSTSIWLGYFCNFIENDYSFKIPLLSQCLFGFILLIGTIALIESPRWLLENDHDEEALIVIADLFSNGNVHDDISIQHFKSIKESILLAKINNNTNNSPLSLLKQYPLRIFIACSAQFFAQFNGINVISYYAPLIFEKEGWIGSDCIKLTGINSIIYLLSTLIPWKLSDYWGRKPLLILGGLLMAISLLSISISSKFNLSLNLILSIIIYNASFGFSWGPIGWLIGPEVLPNNARIFGSSLATSTNWISNFIVGQMTPILLEKLKWKLYLIHATSCIISILVVYFIYPETKGISLEQIEQIFSNDLVNNNDGNNNARTPMINSVESIDVEIPSLHSIHKHKTTNDSVSIKSFFTS